MPLWNHWLNAVQELRPACSRARTFLWMLLALAGLCSRAGGNAGVTSFVRVLNYAVMLEIGRCLALFLGIAR